MSLIVQYFSGSSNCLNAENPTASCEKPLKMKDNHGLRLAVANTSKVSAGRSHITLLVAQLVIKSPEHKFLSLEL